MPCQSCEERRKLILEQVAAINAAARARSQAFMEAVKNRRPWRPDPVSQEPQDKQQQP